MMHAYIYGDMFIFSDTLCARRH